MEKSGKQVEIAYQRDILGILVSQSYLSKTGVDIDKVFTYPLAHISILSCTPVGENRKTAKSKLYGAVMCDLHIINESTLNKIPNFPCCCYQNINRNKWNNKRFGMENIANGTKTILKYIPSM